MRANEMGVYVSEFWCYGLNPMHVVWVFESITKRERTRIELTGFGIFMEGAMKSEKREILGETAVGGSERERERESE